MNYQNTEHVKYINMELECWKLGKLQEVTLACEVISDSPFISQLGLKWGSA